MLFKKYWKAILGFAFWLGPIWDFIKWLLDWRGRIDAIAASYHDLGGYHVMIAFFLNPPSWLYPPFMIAGLVLIWWNFHRTPRNIHHVEILEHVGVGESVPSVAVRSAITCGNGLDNWENLYEEYSTEQGKELRLRFLPDTRDQSSDALLLICYGYKVLRKIDAISSSFANDQIEYLLHNAPGTRQPYIIGFMASINMGQQKRDFGQKRIIEGDIERIELSRGGKYQLTPQGENKAKALAREMIRRA